MPLITDADNETKWKRMIEMVCQRECHPSFEAFTAEQQAMIWAERSRQAALTERDVAIKRAESAEGVICRAREIVDRPYPKKIRGDEITEFEVKQLTELAALLSSTAPCRHAAIAERVEQLCPGRECGEDSDYGRGWDAGVQAAQKFLKEG